MARSWFYYLKTTPTDRLIASNYVAIAGTPLCPGTPVNICAVFATVSGTQPVLTANLQAYLNAAGVPPYLPQPQGPKYVLTRAQ